MKHRILSFIIKSRLLVEVIVNEFSDIGIEISKDPANLFLKCLSFFIAFIFNMFYYHLCIS